MLLSVIVLTYKVPYHLLLCVQSVERSIASIDAEIIVVDNNSQDETEELIKANFKHVIFQQNKENLGFASRYFACFCLKYLFASLLVRWCWKKLLLVLEVAQQYQKAQDKEAGGEGKEVDSPAAAAAGCCDLPRARAFPMELTARGTDHAHSHHQ